VGLHLTLGYCRRMMAGSNGPRAGNIAAYARVGLQRVGRCAVEILYDWMKTVVIGTDEHGEIGGLALQGKVATGRFHFLAPVMIRRLTIRRGRLTAVLIPIFAIQMLKTTTSFILVNAQSVNDQKAGHGVAPQFGAGLANQQF